MLKKVSKKILPLVSIVFLVLPVFSLAADDYTLLAPLPGLSTKLSQDNILGTYIPVVFKILIGLAAVAAVFKIVMGGFQYMTSDAFMGKKEGKETAKNAVIALVLVVAAWLILNEINPNLLEINLKIEPATTTPVAVGELGKVATGSDLLSGTSLLADGTNRSTLLPEVTVNNPPCTTDRTSNCTNLNGLPQLMIASLKSLQRSCAAANNGSCVVQITGGTETSLHTTGTKHGPGNAVVDLSATQALNKYLGITNPKNGDKKTVGGLNFIYEVYGANEANTGPHWHVTQ